jgi:hypothetical protein
MGARGERAVPLKLNTADPPLAVFGDWLVVCKYSDAAPKWPHVPVYTIEASRSSTMMLPDALSDPVDTVKKSM